MAGALLSFPLVAAATAPQETFLPPQQIPLPGTMTFGKLVVADVNGDGYDDIVAIGLDVIDSSPQTVLDVYVNDGKPRSSTEDVTFTRQRMILTAHTNTDAVIDKVRFSGGFDLQVVDLDNDKKPDILASDAATGEIFVLWNQGANAPAPFTFVPDVYDPAAPSMTFFSQLAQRGSFGPVLGTPIYVTAADLGEGSGRKSIIAYHGSLQPDPSSTDDAPFNQRNYESLAIIYPTGSRGFDIVKQRDAWPGCDLSFGSACPGWNDGVTPYSATTGFAYNFRPADMLRLNFDTAASDILAIDVSSKDSATHYYTPAVLRPNASPGLQVLTGHGTNGSDSIWLQGGGQAHEFVADNSLKLMRQRTVIDTVAGNERSAGAVFGSMSTGATPLITAGGTRVVYEPSNAGSAVTQPVPDYLNRTGQVGAWVGWVPLTTGSALLSLSDYCRSPDPCASELSWFHKPLNGEASPAWFWGGSQTLVLLDFAKETTTSSCTQYEPFFQKPDEAHFQAFSITGGAVNHKPFIAAGHFASPSEAAIVMLDHADGAPTDAMWNHLSLYRPDTAKTYASPTPHLDGLTVGRFIEDGLADIGNTLPKGEVSAVLVGSNLGADTADAIRYVTVHDKATGTMKGIFPANVPETVKELSKDGVVVPGLSTLDIGSYTLEVHNATSMASMNLNVVNPFGITTTDADWRAGGTCGLLPNTKDGNLWPKQIAVSVTDFPASVQAVRWINQDDGSVVELGSEGGTYDAAAKTVTLIVPQGKLKDGKWRPAIESGGVWQPVQRTWNVAHDSATVASCAAQVNFVNEEAYAQCDNDNYYMDSAQYAVWPHLVNGSFRFFGSGFAQNEIKSAAIKQGSHRYFSSSLELVGDNEIHVEFGDRSDLAPDVETELYFYSENGDVVESEGVPAVGGKQHWRTVRKGTCVPQMPQIVDILNTGSGPDGTWQSGDTVKVSGKNSLYPVPTATKLVLKGDDGSLYLLENPRLPDDWYTHHYDNDNMVLYFTVPDDLSVVKISGGTDSHGTTELGGGLVVAGSGALATTAVSDGALAILASNPAGLAVIGSTVTGLSIYAGYGNAKWLIKKVAMALDKPSGGGGKEPPGKNADNQAKSPYHLWVVVFVSQPTALARTNTGPLEVVIIKAASEAEAIQKAPFAVSAYMVRNHAEFGPVDYFSGPTDELPLDYAAGITSVHDLGSADGTNPNTSIVVNVGMMKSQVPIYTTCVGVQSTWPIVAQTDPNSNLGTELVSIEWRRDVMSQNSPPEECPKGYEEIVGNITSQTPGFYTTTFRNNYTIY